MLGCFVLFISFLVAPAAKHAASSGEYWWGEYGGRDMSDTDSTESGCSASPTFVFNGLRNPAADKERRKP